MDSVEELVRSECVSQDTTCDFKKSYLNRAFARLTIHPLTTNNSILAKQGQHRGNVKRIL